MLGARAEPKIDALINHPMRRAPLALALLLLVVARAAPQTADRRPRSVPNAADSKFGPQIVFPLQQSFKRTCGALCQGTELLRR